MIYTRTAAGEPLKREISPREKNLLEQDYRDHHDRLTNAVELELQEHQRATLVDCHSFPSVPLPCDLDQSTPRPDFCIGTDSFHTPPEFADMAVQTIEAMG